VEVLCHAFLTCALDEEKSLSSNHSLFHFWEDTPVTSSKMALCCSLWQSDRVPPHIDIRTQILRSANPQVCHDAGCFVYVRRLGGVAHALEKGEKYPVWQGLITD
jgi:hypothetical protein